VDTDIVIEEDTTESVQGVEDPLGEVNYFFTVNYFWHFEVYIDTLGEPHVTAGRIRPDTPINSDGWHSTVGNNAFGSNTYYFQLYSYRQFQNNVFAQCEKKTSRDMSPTTGRDSGLESAVKNMIQTDLDNGTNHLQVKSYYYSEQREPKYMGTDWLAILNAVRGYPEPLTEDSWCMGSSAAVVAEWIATATANHDDAYSTNYIGMEVLCVALDSTPLADIIAGWMASPLHANAIMGVSWKVAGYASGTYPSSVTQITFGAGMYSALTETYTTSETVQNIPLLQRGHVKCYVVRMTP
jgi:hypothetical protein